MGKLLLSKAFLKIRKVPIYTFIIAVFPVLALYNHNIFHLNFSIVFRALVASFLFGALFLVIVNVFIKDWHRAGLLTSFGLILLFSFLAVSTLIEGLFDFKNSQLFIFAGYIGAFIYFGRILIKKLGNNQEFISALTIACLTLLIIPVAQLLFYWFSILQANAQVSEINKDLLPAVEDVGERTLRPDIYYFILDAYTNAETIKEFGGFDNEPFLQELSNLGFYVAPCSQSNYSTTYHSLRSSFYMDYLENISTFPLPTLKESILLKTLELFEYRVITFEGRAEGETGLRADIRFTRNYSLPWGASLTNGLNEFEYALLSTFYIPIFGFEEDTSRNPFLSNVLTEHYLQTQYILDTLPRVQSFEGPKFVFAHLVLPHRPYIFTPDGKFDSTSSLDDPSGYWRNTEYLNSRLIPILSSIIEQSEIPPIIILQGDHGPTDYKTPEQRMAILNAYYVEQEVDNQLYSSISPVNTFRLVANHYFSSNFPLLEDKSYYFGEIFRRDNEYLDAKIIENSCKEGME